MEGAAHFYKLEEDILCSICLHELSDPISITCGHTFCRSCITEYWDAPELRDYCCPECRKICNKDQLIPAYRLKNMVSNVQQAVIKLQGRQDPPSALRLVYTDRDGKLQLDESVAQRCFLDTEVSEYPPCLICVIGEKRRGKSTLLNYIMRALRCLERGQPVSLGQDKEPLTGFEWRKGGESVTKGIWIWSKPFILKRNKEKMVVFLLDTEGSLDIGSDRKNGCILSALSILLSSYLIFNVNGCLKTSDLDYLEMYLHVTEQSRESFPVQHLQHLDILVRDWQDPDNCGREAARTYLQHESEKLQNGSEHSSLVTTLQSPIVSGFLFPQPGNKFIRSSQVADMYEEFRNHFEEYIFKLVAEIWLYQKTDISGRKITFSRVWEVLKDFFPMLSGISCRIYSPLEFSQQMKIALENEKLRNEILQEFEMFQKEKLKLLGVLKKSPPNMRIIANEKVSALLDRYTNDLKENNDEKKKKCVEEMKSLLAEKQESFCKEYSTLFAVGVGCAIGCGVLAAGCGVGAGIAAGTVLSVGAAVGVGAGSAAGLGVIGAGIGEGLVAFADRQNNENANTEPNTETPIEDANTEPNTETPTERTPLL